MAASMDPRQRGALAFAWAPALLATPFLWSLTSATPSVDIAYCASQNTGLTDTDVTYNYMSDGYCSTYCFTNNSYPLAVVQDKDCWCANLIPAESDQTDTDDCDSSCPGYPSDWCGGNGLYGYMTNSAVAASGTATADSASSSSSSKHSSSTATTTSTSEPSSSSQTSQTTSSLAAETSTFVIYKTETVHQTTSHSVAASSTSTTTTSSSSGSTSSATDSTDSTSTSSILVQTVTIGGAVTTVTTTPTAAAGSASAGQSTSSATSSTGLTSGQVAGIVVGVIIALAGLTVAGVFMWYRRRRRNQEEGTGDGTYDTISKRGSSAGMMGTPPTGNATNRYANGSDGRAMAENWESNPALSNMSASGRRRSQLMPVDPRLHYGKGIYPRENNISHESFSSLQDNQDYSRPVHEPKKVLRAMNPDPDNNT